MEKISVIIPIHNGEKHINHLYNNINSQNYKNLEIIMVENFSKDNSLFLLKNLAQRDKRIIVLESLVKGTSLARKKGIEQATGKYTLFMDQDDEYIDEYSVEKMLKTIVETNTQMCQFSYWKKGVNKRKVSFTKEQIIFDIEEVRKQHIKSILGGDGYFSPTVWSKIYLTDVLKDAIKYVDISLYFAEDQFLNVCCMTSPHLNKICVDTEPYYVWNAGIGFSSKKDSGLALLKDYQQTKPRISRLLVGMDADNSVLINHHMESIYFIVNLTVKTTNCIICDKNIELVNEFLQTAFFIDAKEYLADNYPSEKMYDELRFLISDYSPEEFMNYFRYRTSKSFYLRIRIKQMIEKIMSH